MSSIRPLGIEMEACDQSELVGQVLGASDIFSVLSKQNGSFSEEKRDFVGQFDIVDSGSSGLVLLACVEVEPVHRAEVNISRGHTLLQDRGGHQIIANQELGISNFINVGIAVEGEDKEERVENGSKSSLCDEQGIVVLEERVPQSKIGLGCFQDHVSQGIGLLASAAIIVVISGKGVEGSKLEPSAAQLFGGVASEPADVRADHLEAPHLVEEVIGNRALQEIEVSIVVSSPMESILVGAKSRSSRDDEWPQILALQEQVGGIGLQEGSEGMNISFLFASIMS